MSRKRTWVSEDLSGILAVEPPRAWPYDEPAIWISAPGGRPAKIDGKPTLRAIANAILRALDAKSDDPHLGAAGKGGA